MSERATLEQIIADMGQRQIPLTLVSIDRESKFERISPDGRTVRAALAAATAD